MEETKFKTNIKCSACVEKVTPSLDEVVGKGNWRVDLTDPQRTLTISATAESAKLNEALNKVGYRAEKM
jgi:copper chaperone